MITSRVQTKAVSKIIRMIPAIAIVVTGIQKKRIIWSILNLAKATRTVVIAAKITKNNFTRKKAMSIIDADMLFTPKRCPMP